MHEVNTIDLDRLPKQIVAAEVIRQLIEVSELAENIFKSFPKEVREEYSSTAHIYDEEGIEGGDKIGMALAIARMNPAARVYRLATLYETLEYIEEDFRCEGDDIKMTSLLMLLFQRLGKNSKQDLRQGLEDSSESFLLIKVAGRNSEVVRRFNLPKEVADHFGLTNHTGRKQDSP